jgi:hypothetical protein
MNRRLPLAAAAVVFLATFATAGPVGSVRDEGYYFEAAKSYQAWLVLLLRNPAAAIGATERYWSYNFEHPGLAKLLFATSHLVFTSTLHVLPDAQSWRLPAFFFAALLAWWLAALGQERSRACALLAPALFFCAERTFFHAHLAAFDVPICAMTAGVGVALARAIGILPGPASRMRRGAWPAFVYGCALAVKHNAWLLPPVLAVHALFLPGELRSALRMLPWLLLSPIVLFAAWPLLWHDPARHLRDWIAFHAHHVHYAWYYFGRELRAPPFPVVYPLAVLAVALPLPQVALATAAGLRLLWDFFRRRLPPLRLLELGLAGCAVLPFLLGTTPIFGGIKHWLAFLALLMPEAAALLEGAARAATGAFAWLTSRRAVATAAVAALLPGAWQIAHLHPYGTSAYGELAGDLPGAASLGMQRQYWSNNVTGVLPWLNTHAPRARVFFHEVNVESYRAYQQSGALRADIGYAAARRTRTMRRSSGTGNYETASPRPGTLSTPRCRRRGSTWTRRRR